MWLFKGKCNKHIEKLESEKDTLKNEIKMYPPGSLGEARLNLTVAFWSLKISFWEAINE